MKILYTPQIFTKQKFGGISRYFAELICNLDGDIHYELSLMISNNEYIKHKYIGGAKAFFPNCDFRGKQRVIKLLNDFSFVKASRKYDYDIVHPTYYDPSFLNKIGDTPFVVTVYDMIHELYPHLFSETDITSKNKRILCDNATKIIAISNQTKIDLINIFNIDPDKIEVVYLGQSFDAHKQFSNMLDLPDKYVLFTGGRWGYKNFNRFLEAFAKLDKKYHLVCTGSKFSDEETILFEKLGVKDRVHTMYLSDSELAEVYSRAELFVFPSEYEGFGIPILEAFASNCPIALSNTSCFPEIAGDGGAYFDPLDVNSIHQTMSEVLDSEELKKSLVKNGRKQLDKFSWEKMAMETCAIYKSII